VTLSPGFIAPIVETKDVDVSTGLPLTVWMTSPGSPSVRRWRASGTIVIAFSY
jgi:hypothetical protein